MTHWTDAKPHTWDIRRGGKNLSDAQVADKVRMLMRSDLGHEMVCTLARDRIASLARWHDRLEAFVQCLAMGGILSPKESANELLNQMTAERGGPWYEWPPKVRALEDVLADADDSLIQTTKET